MKKVLIIDPSETFIRFLGRIVTKMGYETLAACDTKTGLALIREKMPDLVISELHFGEYEGLALCAETAGFPETADIPVVFVTTDGSRDGRQRAEDAGCCDYLTKPVTINDIHDMLQRNLPFEKKRLTPRIRVELDVELVVGKRRLSAKTETIGFGGMLVTACCEGAYVGHTIQISLYLSSCSEPAKLTGEIIYLLESAESSSLPGIGIKFTDMGRDGGACLAQFLEEQLSLW
ncbi:MAG: response regulator [Geobacteraceae bacterium]|nr:response regulator [Geobacteraceae bacterium]